MKLTKDEIIHIRKTLIMSNIDIETKLILNRILSEYECMANNNVIQDYPIDEEDELDEHMFTY